MTIISRLLLTLSLGLNAHAARSRTNCQELFARHTERSAPDFLPWSTMPTFVAPYASVHVAIRLRLPPNASVPLDGLGLGVRNEVLPSAFVHVREGHLFALMAGVQEKILAAAERLAQRYGAYRLEYQLLGDSARFDLVNLPLPTAAEPFGPRDFTREPLTTDVVFVDVLHDRVVLGFRDEAVSRAATRALQIPWISEDQLLKSLRRNDKFAVAVSGGTLISGPAYAALKPYEVRPVAEALAALLPKLPDGNGSRQRRFLDEVAADSSWSICAGLRGYTDLNKEYFVTSLMYHAWRNLAPQTNPSDVWRRVLAAGMGPLRIHDSILIDPERDQALRAWFGELVEAIRASLAGAPPFDLQNYEPRADDALDIWAYLYNRYPEAGDIEEAFGSAWRDQLGEAAPRLNLPPDGSRGIRDGTNEKARSVLLTAFADLRARLAARAAEVQKTERTSADTSKRRKKAAASNPPGTDGPTARAILESLRARFPMSVGVAGAAQMLFDRLYEEDLGAPAPDFKFTASAAKNAFYNDQTAAATAIKSAHAQYQRGVTQQLAARGRKNAP